MSKFAVVESHFEYKGHDCICIFTVKGYRCGYVSVDDNRDFWDYDLDCHCGLSFGAAPLTKDFNPKLVEMEIQSPTFLQPVRSLEYVENECRKIVDQLAAGK